MEFMTNKKPTLLLRVFQEIPLISVFTNERDLIVTSFRRKSTLHTVCFSALQHY